MNVNYSVTLLHSIPNSSSQQFSDALTYLADEDLIYLYSFSNEAVKMRSTTGRYLLRKNLCHLYPSSYKSFKLSYGQNGKPYFHDLPDFYFNISHSNNLVAFICSDKPCGIDIEMINNYRQHIAHRFFHEKEFNYLDNVNANIQNEEFYHFWTAKESYIKMTGQGLSDGLSKFYFDASVNKIIDIDNNTTTDITSQKILLQSTMFFMSISIKK